MALESKVYSSPTVTKVHPLWAVSKLVDLMAYNAALKFQAESAVNHVQVVFNGDTAAKVEDNYPCASRSINPRSDHIRLAPDLSALVCSRGFGQGGRGKVRDAETSVAAGETVTLFEDNFRKVELIGY